MERLLFSVLAQSIKEDTKIMLAGDIYSVQTKIHAMEAASHAILRASTDIASYNGVESVSYPDLDDYFKGLVTVAAKPMSEEDVIKVLEHVRAVFSFVYVYEPDDTFGVKYCSSAASFVPEICAVTIKIFIKFRSKSEIVRWCDEIFENICLGRGFYDNQDECWDIVVESGLIPILTNVITTNSMYGALADTTSSEKLCEYALHILCTSMSISCPQLPSWDLLEVAYPVLHCLLNSNNCDILLNGCEIISQFLTKTLEKMITLQFKDRKTGLQYVLLVVEHCLNSINAENIDVSVDLRLCLLEIIGSLTTFELHVDLDACLKMTLRMLREWKTEEMVKRLLVMFAHLINTQYEEVLDSLSKPASSNFGQNSLRDVIANGLCKGYKSFESENQTTVNLALLNIYTYGVDHPKSYLHGDNFEAVQALLLTIEVSDVGGKDPVE